MDLFSSDLHDDVSGRSGLGIFDAVESWLDTSFANGRVEHHATMFEGDRGMIWYTARGRHVATGFQEWLTARSREQTSHGFSSTCLVSRA